MPLITSLLSKMGKTQQGLYPGSYSLLSELDDLIEPSSVPDWTKNYIKEENGDYVTQDGNVFFSEEDAQRYTAENYYGPDEIDLSQVINDLKNTRAINTGGIPEYLTEAGIDLMDSSTWDVPYNDAKLFETPDQAEKMIPYMMNEAEVLDYIDRQSDYKDPEFSQYIKDIYMEENFPPPYATNEQGIPYKLKTYDHLPPHPMNEMGAVPLTRKDYGVNRTRSFSPHPIEREIFDNTNILDYYASQGNPELKRGSSTGFFPTTNYPMPGIMGLQDILDNNELIRKYGKENDVSKLGSQGYYSPRLDEIALNKDYLKYTYGSPGNRYLDRDDLNETLGHEGIHYMMYPKHRGFDKYLTDAFPYPDNYQSDYSSSDHHIQRVPYHPTIHYIDNTYFPNKWSHGEDLNFKGLQNFNQFQNITSDSDNYMEPIEDSWNYTPDRFGQNVMGAQEAMDFEIYGQGWNPTPNPPSFNPHAGMAVG